MIHQADPVKTEQTIKALKLFSLFVIVAAVIWGAWGAFKSHLESTSEEAFSALAQADLMEMKALRSAKVLSKDPIQVLLEEADASQKEAYVAALRTVLEKHNGSAAAHLAALRLGRWFVESEQLEEAQGQYVKLMSETEKDQEQSLFYAMAAEALIVVYEKQGKNEDALALLDKVLNHKSLPLRPILLLSRARLLAVLSRKDEAKSVYSEIVKEFPDSPYSQQARALSVKVSL